MRFNWTLLNNWRVNHVSTEKLLKKEEKIENLFLLKKLIKTLRNIYKLDPDTIFHSSTDPGSGSASKWNGSLAIV